MSKKSEFVSYISNVLTYIGEVDAPLPPMNEEAQAYWEAFNGANDVEKPLFTDNGKLIMEYLKTLPSDGAALKARDIAEALFISSRTVSGAMRKLVTDGFVEKIGQDPVMYNLTEQGKNIEIN